MKYVLVTGACGGMGKSTVAALKNAGYGVFALDITECAAEDGVIPIAADVTDEKAVADAAEKVRAVTDELFALVHFAGVYALDSFVEMPYEKLRKIFDINLFGAMLVNRTFLPFIKRGGKIVMTTSELAPLDPLPFTGIYAVTKGALDKYAYSLAMELQLLGISVSVIRAGAVKTGMLGASSSALDRFCASTALYPCNAKRFKKVVDNVEAKCVPPRKIADKAVKILGKRKPKFAYSVNRNPFLLMLNALPVGLQMRIIKGILKNE
jgi:short-chain dehydrogenase/reductase SDR